eukprot:8607090-Alexandrium_andersonii.AAC.1
MRKVSPCGRFRSPRPRRTWRSGTSASFATRPMSRCTPSRRPSMLRWTSGAIGESTSRCPRALP